MKVFGKKVTLVEAMPWILIVFGTIGLFCALVLTYDKIQVLANPNFRLGCDLNPVISCGSVLESKQAEAFGFPNPFMGIPGFAVIVTTGVLMLAGLGKIKRWYWLGMQAGTVFGLLFVHWLLVQSLYVIGALCPYCVVVWVSTITLFWYTTLYNIQMGHIKLNGSLQKIALLARRHHLDILALWLLIIAGLILKRFWYYYGDKIL